VSLTTLNLWTINLYLDFLVVRVVWSTVPTATLPTIWPYSDVAAAIQQLEYY